jgi:plastocyanin
VTCQDEATREEVDCLLSLDGESISKTFTATEEGNHTIKASLEGYQSAEKVFSILAPPILTYAPEELKLNENTTITFSKKTSYSVIYKKDLASPSETVLSGEGDSLTFTPDRAGYYYIYLKDTRVKTYEVKGGLFKLPKLGLPGDWRIYVAGGVLLLAVYLLFKKKEVGRKRITMLPTKRGAVTVE